MTKETNNKLSKKEQIKKSKKNYEMSRKKKTDADSDHDSEDIEDSDSDDMDVHEYRKFLSKIFPSKNLNKKIASGESLKKIKKQLDEEYINESDNNVEIKNKKNKKQLQNKKKFVEKDEDDEEDEVIKVSKSSKNKKRVIESNTEYDEDDDEDYDEDYDENSKKKLNTKKKGSEKLNIIFTIGGVDDEDEWEDYDSDEDEDYDSNEETENEDESVSSDSSDDEEDESEEDESEEDESEEDESEEGESLIRQKRKNESKKNLKSVELDKKCSGKNKKEIIDRIKNVIKSVESKSSSENDEMYNKLKHLLSSEPNNKILQKCVNMYDEDIKKNNLKKEKKEKKQKAKNSRIFRKIVKDKNTMNDYKFFEGLEMENQKKLIKELREINKITRVEKPYRMTLLESDIPTLFKSAAMKKINSLRYMEPGSGEFYKIKNWVDTFMRIPFGKYQNLPVSIENGIENCHEFMENAKNTLDNAVYGLNDAKLQIMQMLGQLLTNPKSIGTAIAIHGPPGTGKTSLVKEGISKILNRPFAFIALGGATDSSFLEGHSYTYEGSTWGKIVQILVDSKCMNPVIYFDELDKISETPRGEEIAGILTHLTDTSQNSQFHDKYFSEIDFDLSKCLFIFSYNDESKVNAILKDRMYRIQTKGYDRKQKIQIANNYLLKNIRQQVKFESSDIIIPDDVLGDIIETHCNKEDGVRNLKRCLEIIYTKLNLFRLMKPGTNLFQEDLSLNVEFPLTITKNIVEKLIKLDTQNFSALYSMYC